MRDAASPLRRRAPRTIAGLAVAWVILTALAWGALSLVTPPAAPLVNVRWRAGLSEPGRLELERRFHLTNGALREGTTWQYLLTDWSRANIRTLVGDPQVEDTHHLDRQRFRPDAHPAPSRRLLTASGLGGVALMLALGLIAGFPRTKAWRSELAALVVESGATTRPPNNRRLTAAVAGAGVLASAAMTWLAGAAFWPAVAALVVAYAGGYVAGSLLLARVDGLAFAVIRTIAGLMLLSLGFLLSLVLRIPWFTVPAVVIGTAIVIRRRAAWSTPHQPLGFRWDGAAAGLLAVVILSPIAITFFSMAPGRYPPVFYNVDTAYVLEKVHALVAADRFPPPSLSTLGAQRTYHYGTQAMAALISRSSGLLPHHALFLIVLPLLAGGCVAAAVAVARQLAPAVPRSVALPLLLISTPSLARPFWDRLGAELSATGSSGSWLDGLTGDFGLWGILSNEAQNVGGDFVILATIASVAATRRFAGGPEGPPLLHPPTGWLLPAFLIGSGVIFKTTVGIALVAGFALAETWRAVNAKRWASPQLVLALALFAVTYGMFFAASFDSPFRVELFAFDHLREIARVGGVPGLLADAIWLFLPALVVLSARIADPEQRSAPLLLMAVGPLLVINATRLVRVGGAGAGLDWLQVSHAVPFFVHAFALSLAGRRWQALGRARRLMVLLAMTLSVAPVTAVAAGYSARLIRQPSSGLDFVDNRVLAEALAVIPTSGSIIVTNDLRYPADNFSRHDRQMQIPALYGHQAFAVNYAYEPIEPRRPLQALLQRTAWSGEILDAARAHRWTHFVVRKDFAHPAPIPLEPIFENEAYAVFRFPSLSRAAG